jgi:hypothetical protein
MCSGGICGGIEAADMAIDDNPYDFNGHNVERPIPRSDLLEEIKKELLHERGSGYLLGGKGMGKTVFLSQLRQALEPDCTVVTFERAPGKRTIDEAKRALIEGLVETCSGADGDLPERLRSLEMHPDSQKILYEYLDRKSDLRTLVLLYDELDTYTRPKEFGQQWFGIIEQARKKKSNRLKVFAAGSLSVFLALDGLGSPFRSASRRFILQPISRAELSMLAERFGETGQDIKDDILDAIMLHSGGNLRNATYGLQKLWRKLPVELQAVVELYDSFRKVDEGLRHTRRTIASTSVSKLPLLFWTAILKSNGSLEEAQVNSIRADGEGGLYLEPQDVLDLLVSAGLVEVLSSVDSYPIQVRAIPSVVSFDPRVGEDRTVKPTLREQLVADLREVLGSLHSYTLDLVKGGKVAEERIFSMFIASNLRSRGWASALREPIIGAGRRRARHA